MLADLLNGYGMNVPFTNAMYQKEVPLVVEEIFPEHLILQETAEEVEQALTEELLRNWDTAYVYDERMRAQIEEQFSYQYPYEAMQKMKLKFTVSELKKRSEPEEEAGEILYEEPEIVPLVPNLCGRKQSRDTRELCPGHPGERHTISFWNCWILEKVILFRNCMLRRQSSVRKGNLSRR